MAEQVLIMYQAPSKAGREKKVKEETDGSSGTVHASKRLVWTWHQAS